jgi:hypothetical protein
MILKRFLKTGNLRVWIEFTYLGQQKDQWRVLANRRTNEQYSPLRYKCFDVSKQRTASVFRVEGNVRQVINQQAERSARCFPGLLLYAKDVRSMLPRNVDKLPPDYTASYPGRKYS